MKADRSIQRALLRRVAVAVLAVSVLTAGVVVYRERGRTEELASERAAQGVAMLQLALAAQLDAGLRDHAAVQAFLDRLWSSPTQVRTGSFVIVAVRDATGAEVARAAAPGRAPFETNGLLPEVLPLHDSSGRVAGSLTAWFQVSDWERTQARIRLLDSIAFGIGVVLATALLIYPVVSRLLRRLETLSRSLLDANLETLGVVGSTIAKRDSDTDAHNYRVTVYAGRMGEAAGLDAPTMRALLKGAFLHDVGKLGIPDAILLKPGKLDAGEFGEMKRHVPHGLDIIERSGWLRDAASVVGHHHEKWDGSGYGTGLRGEQIPLPARIFAVADVFDALTSRRPYKEPLSFDVAMGILEQGRGTHFDPRVLDLFARLAPELHGRLAGEEGDAPRAEVATLMDRWFRSDLGALL